MELASERASHMMHILGQLTMVYNHGPHILPHRNCSSDFPIELPVLQVIFSLSYFWVQSRHCPFHTYKRLFFHPQGIYPSISTAVCLWIHHIPCLSDYP